MEQVEQFRDFKDLRLEQKRLFHWLFHGWPVPFVRGQPSRAQLYLSRAHFGSVRAQLDRVDPEG